MDRKTFKEDDKERVIEFLNFITKYFSVRKDIEWGTQETIQHFKLLSYMQKELIPKIEDNILEILEVVKSKED